MDKRLKLRRKTKFTWVISLLLMPIILFLFQNCTSGFESGNSKRVAKKSTDSSSNGEGYGGMVSYSNLTLADQCAGQADNRETTIQVSEDKSFLVRENCKDIEPKEIFDVGIMEHNTLFALYSDKIFEDDKTKNTSEVFCRGSNYNATDSTQDVTDAFVYKIGTTLFAEVKIGIYSRLEMVYSNKSKPFEVVKSKIDNKTAYFGIDYDGGISYELIINEQNKIASLESNNIDPEGDGPFTADPREDGTTVINYDHETIFLDNLDCYRHD